MFLEQNPHVDYAALTAAVEQELRRPPGTRVPPAPLHTLRVETAPPGASPAWVQRLGERLQRWPRLHRFAHGCWRKGLAALPALSRRPLLFYSLRWMRWLATLPRLADWVGAHQARLDEAGAALQRQAQTQAQLHDQLRTEAERQDARAAQLQDALAEGLAQAASERARLEARQVLMHETLAALMQETARLKAAPGTPRPASGADGETRPAAPLSATMARFYQDFEDAWRGAPETIRARVAHYLPPVQAARAGTTEAPFADLGCGRGEWLAVLSEAGLVAFGVDSNSAAIERCRAQGLSVAEADLLDWLRRREAASLGGIGALHVVEHLPFETLVDVLDEALRVLRPGGVLILETPDPANLLVATHSFWLDPSHLRPIPADLLAFTVRSRGFADVQVERLHPADEDLRFPPGDAVGDRFNTLLYGPQDYAVIARKAAG